MSKDKIWFLAKILEGLGLVVILGGVFLSMRLGFQEEGLASMGAEFQGLMIGGLLFLAGWSLEQRKGMR